ncbi:MULTISPECIES: hypothetical protein [Bradyrhizobium]|uniref:hypothetical protein n=1 Tax=Bradyrhizobium TaxID=374 RepID=UPI0004B1A968|nr:MULTISPECIES: hypothetical protein [unclassified Bradyrhizobium]MDA9456559.1 hypothetical protein [Bradyrhizobium sp. CCBAU 21359]
MLGFSKKEIDRLLKGAHGGPRGRTEPDAAPARPKVAVSRLGDTWLLGGHHGPAAQIYAYPLAQSRTVQQEQTEAASSIVESSMNGIMDMMTGMGWSISLIVLLVLALIVLGIAALIKYLAK